MWLPLLCQQEERGSSSFQNVLSHLPVLLLMMGLWLLLTRVLVVATVGLRLAGAQWFLSLQVLYNVFESFVALGGDNVTGVDCVKGIGMWPQV